MKALLFRVIFIFAMALTSVNVCFAVDSACEDESVAKSVHLESDSEENTNEDCKSEECICSLSCSNVITLSSSEDEILNVFQKANYDFTYIASYYPEIFLSLEKPPII